MSLVFHTLHETERNTFCRSIGGNEALRKEEERQKDKENLEMIINIKGKSNISYFLIYLYFRRLHMVRLHHLYQVFGFQIQPSRVQCVVEKEQNNIHDIGRKRGEIFSLSLLSKKS